MTKSFDSFVLFADMRTGSNFLETNLNALDGVACHGEAFNQEFVAYPNKNELFGIGQDERDKDPYRLLTLVKAQHGLNGFRYFHDHDPRVLDQILADKSCAKIILIRNPVESYISLQIAIATNQWKLTEVKRRKDAKAKFDPLAFQDYLEALQGFQGKLLNSLQTSGQSAFYIAYEDIRNLDVINGLAQWLGVDARLDSLDDSLKPQNPGPLSDKVENPEAIATTLEKLDTFNLWRTPNFEPRRGAAVPSYVFCDQVPLLYMPMRGGPEDAVLAWLAQLDGKAAGELATRKNQKELRQWKRKAGNHRSFTVLRHPVERAHHVFCQRFVNGGSDRFTKIRDILKRQFKVRLPKDRPGPGWTVEAHREAFEGYLKFVKANLNGQTSVRVDADWASQTQTLSGFAELQTPDLVLREDRLDEELGFLARSVGVNDVPSIEPAAADSPYPLNDFYDASLEDAVFDVYQRDYVMLGFKSWR